MARKDRRARDRQQLASNDFIGGLPVIGGPAGGAPNPGGWGIGGPDARPANAGPVRVDPYRQPKSAGINIMTQAFSSNYFLEWNTTTWRFACDQAINTGQTMSIATLYTWAYQSSPFIQGLFAKLGSALDEVKFFAVDRNGEPNDKMTAELVNKPWLMELRREILFSYFWGFTGLNFDPSLERVYKYPQQQIDCINRMLRSGTYTPYNGEEFAGSDNLIFVQPSTNQESFLGYMQPITKAFIMMNQSSNNWLSAGRRLAFPVMTVGYPQNTGALNMDDHQINQYKLDAENIAANIDPSKGFVFPYTLLPNGEMQKAVEIDFQETKAGQNMYKVYSEFNDDYKNEIREFVLGGTLSSSGSKSGSGSRSLGEVHERMFKQAVKGKLEFVLNVLNSEFVPKISKFYSGLPEGWRYEIDRTNQYTLEEITSLSMAVNENGLRLSKDFFIDQGIPDNYLEDAPTPVAPVKPKPVNEPDPNVNAAKKKVYW